MASSPTRANSALSHAVEIRGEANWVFYFWVSDSADPVKPGGTIRRRDERTRQKLCIVCSEHLHLADNRKKVIGCVGEINETTQLERH